MKVRARTYALALSIATLTIGASTPHALAQALQSYVLENVKTFSHDKETEVLIPRIEVTGANIGRADLERMLTSEQSSSARADIMLNLQAQRIVVPQLIVTRTGKDKGRFVLRDYLVTNLDRARFERISLGGFDGAGTTEDKGEAKLTSGQITLEGGDFSKFAAAAKAGDATDAVGKLRVFSWSGFEVSVADKDIPASAPGGNTLRFGLKSAKANTDYNGDIPTKALASFEGMYFVAPPTSEAGKALANFGYDRVEFGINLDGTYNAASKTFALANYSFSGVNAGTLAFSGGFADIDSTAFTANTLGRLSALMKGKVSDINLRYADAGLFNKALVSFAKSQGKDPAAVRKEWAMMIVGMLPMLMGGDPAALKLSEALSAFVTQPKSLSISLKGKKGPINFTDLSKLADPSALLSQVEITAVANR